MQRLVNDLAAQGMVDFAPNPHHLRAKLVVLTARGQDIFAAAMQRQGPWAEALAAGLTGPEIDTALRVLRALRDRLQLQNDRHPREVRHVEELA